MQAIQPAERILPQGHPGAVIAELLGHLDHFGLRLGIALRPSHLPVASRLRSRAALSLATMVALSNWAMAPSTRRTRTAVAGVSSRKKSGALAGKSQYAQVLQVVVPCKLHSEVAGEPVGTFNDDGPDTVAGDTVEHGSEARARCAGSAPFTAAS